MFFRRKLENAVIGAFTATLMTAMVTGCNGSPGAEENGTSSSASLTTTDPSTDTSDEGRTDWPKPTTTPTSSPTSTPTQTPTPTPTATTTSAPTSEAEAYRQAVIEQTNAYRAQNGLGALTMNAKLNQAAQLYAEAMANQGFFSHYGLDGSTPASRIEAAGYSWRTYGENIAYGQSTPTAVMTAWINSPGHRANILGSAFKEIGVGYAVSKSGMKYWVQDFGTQ